MKKLLFLSFFAITLIAEAQNNVFPLPSGNVGIGTTTPTTELEVIGDIKADMGLFINSLANGATFTDYTDRNLQTRVFGAGKVFTVDQSMFNFFDFPQSNLNSKAIAAITVEDRNFKTRWKYNAFTGGQSDLYYYNKNQSVFYKLSEDGNDNVTLEMAKPNTYVMIGTNSYADDGDLYKLSVQGKVRAHAVKVYTDWADFVFEEDYKLPTLTEVEAHIKEHGHLKDIPSAKEVEEKGIELGEMNKLLLQKIEELTLYTIELKKEVDGLKTKLE